MTELVKFSSRPEFRNPTLVAAWSMDAAGLGWRVTDYLVSKLGGQPFCHIEPVDFFPLGGVTIDNDLVEFPESRFYACPEKDLVLFQSTPPGHEWYRFLNLVLDVARDYCHVREFYTVGSMIALGPHSAPRQFFATVSSRELKEELSPYGLTREVDYETPPGGRPTLSSFFLWATKRRSIPGANLWAPVPFYLASYDDPAACKMVLEFLNHRLGLRLELADLDEEARVLDERINRIRASSPEVDGYISKLENSERLAEGEGEKLAKKVEELLREEED
jgi:proteasome assembly chaperone (PAC2) family protein